MEKPRIRKVQRCKRILRSGPAGLCFGLTEWVCGGRKIEAFGLDPAAAYRNWRFKLRQKKLHGIAMARHKREEREQVERGLAYRKPDGTLKIRSMKQWAALDRANAELSSRQFYEVQKHPAVEMAPWWKFWS
jgi:hypothetical protein